MKSSSGHFHSLFSVLILILQSSQAHDVAGTQFASYVRVNTPARSFAHGVGDPLPSIERRTYQRQRPDARNLKRPTSQSRSGYPRIRPTIPFDNEDKHASHGNSLHVSPWQQNNYMDISIPVLPPSPYKVDSPDPESLWPEGLFLPPVSPLGRFSARSSFGRRVDDAEEESDSQTLDPYLLEGSEAIAAVRRADDHGFLYFHNIPHIQSLLANQELRAKNRLKPHRIASIRHTWPYNRP